MSRVLVTGGAGAIGGHLVSAMAGAGHEVVVLDDLSSGRADAVPDGVQLVRGSVTDADDVARAFAHEPEVVAHLAALFANQNSVDHPVEDLLVNAMGTLGVLQRSHETGVRKVLVCSSSCVYPSTEVLVEEEEGRSHATPYAITKGAAEAYARYFANNGLDVVIVRPFNSYGPGEYPGPYRNVIPNFFDLAMRGEALPITGTGQETRDFTFVTDIVAGMIAALSCATEPGEVFNLGTGRDVPIIELAEIVNRVAGSAAGVRFVPRRGWDTTAARRASIDRAEARLGYRPRVELEEGLERTHAWLRSIGA